ncbi:MAG: glycosyltransferase family 4 protein [Terracidiphilus sp.]
MIAIESNAEQSTEMLTVGVNSAAVSPPQRLAGKRVGMVVFSPYPADPRPRRAVEALRNEGAHVELICEAEGEDARREYAEKLEVIRVPIRHIRGGALSYAYQYSSFILISGAILAWRTLRRRYQLIYVHNMPDILVISGMIPKLFGAKVILDQHDPMPELMRTIFDKDEQSFAVRVIRRLEKWSIGRANLVITVNEACRRIFSNRSCSRDKIGVVMNSPDEKMFQYRDARSYPARRPRLPFVMMYHGSLVERNGLELAVDALHRLQQSVPEAELRVFGRSTPYLERVMSKVRTLGMADKVHFLGPRRLEDLASEIERCDVGVIPNQLNTFTEINTPTRIFEYLALGKPVIAPSTTGVRDYFRPDSLVFFEAGNADDLASQMSYVASHPAEAVDIAEEGQRVYLEHSWQQERETLVNLVANLLNN